MAKLITQIPTMGNNPYRKNLIAIMKQLVNKIFLDFISLEYDNWKLKLSDDWIIHIECLWRLETKDEILFTSRDNLQKFGLKIPIDVVEEINKLHLKRITKAKINEKYGDLLIEFDNKYFFHCINWSCGYESWQIMGPKLYYLVGKNRMK